MGWLLWLIYKYKGPTADAKFNGFDNALDFIDKIREGKMRPADAKTIKWNVNREWLK